MMDLIVHELYNKGFGQTLNFFTSDELKNIKAYFETHKDDFRAALVGKGLQRTRNESIRGDYTLWLDPKHPEKEFEKTMLFLEELKVKVNQRLFLGLKEFECHLAAYPIGAFYSKHLDRFEIDSSRSLSFVFYLHEEWSEGDGGELIIYDQKGNLLREIKPRPASLVYFLSADFPHEVLPSKIERRSLTGWMHTKIIT